MMDDQADESDSSSECLSPIAVLYANDGSVPTGKTVLEDPTSKRLVSLDFSPARKIALIEEILADRNEQQASKDLEPGDALSLVELLDLVRLFLSSLPPASYGNQVLMNNELSASIRPSCVHYLARLCGWHKLLPISALISACERKFPHRNDEHSETCFGRYNDQEVIVKVMKVYWETTALKERRVKVGHLITVR
jgi:hypothetical protein